MYNVFKIKSLRGTSWESEAAEGGRQWTYQTCSEFGWYQSSDTLSWPGDIIPVSFFENMCQVLHCACESSIFRDCFFTSEDNYLGLRLDVDLHGLRESALMLKT